VNVVAPLDATPRDLLRIPDADANVNLAPEIGDLTCDWLKRQFQQPIISTVPMGWGATRDFIAEVSETLGLDIDVESVGDSRLPWYSRSVDSTYLTNKRVFIFADGTHAIAAARIARDEMGFEVVGLGTYSRERARDVRALAKEYGLEALITDDYLAVERAVEALQPELVLGTQMERHIAKRLGLPCAVISTPAHVQDYPARYSPQMGFEGCNVLFDTWVHPLIMGLEEHLLTMFRDDFEFNDTAAPSHLGGEGGGAHQPDTVASIEEAAETDEPGAIAWAVSAEKELRKIPFFVRGKARRNTEHFAIENGLSLIDVETLYEAKAHYSR
jgi:light-independent protochlorophyllide reductase subunit B